MHVDRSPKQAIDILRELREAQIEHDRLRGSLSMPVTKEGRDARARDVQHAIARLGAAIQSADAILAVATTYTTAD